MHVTLFFSDHGSDITACSEHLCEEASRPLLRSRRSLGRTEDAEDADKEGNVTDVEMGDAAQPGHAPGATSSQHPPLAKAWYEAHRQPLEEVLGAREAAASSKGGVAWTAESTVPAIAPLMNDSQVEDRDVEVYKTAGFPRLLQKTSGASRG